MKIAIIEICEQNHYTAVEALALTYATSLDNEISIFTIKNFESSFQFDKENIKIIFLKPSESILSYLQNINSINFDRIHINTISKYYKQFSAIKWHNQLILTVHNIDTWFNNTLTQQINNTFYRLSHPRKNLGLKQNIYLPIKYFFKEWNYQLYRNKIIDSLKKNNQQFLVYSPSQKQYLSNYYNLHNIKVFPFCIHQNSKDLSVKDDYLRICIPGSVDNQRRDYISLFDLLKENYVNYVGKIILDLLGYIPKTEFYLLEKITKLQELGITILYNKNFIGEDDFDKRLSQCDIILGNLKVNLNRQSKYGLTKETGVIFNMIKSAKPGIFPFDYLIPDDLKSICLNYHNNLNEVLIELINNQQKLFDLKKMAKEIVKAYEPQNLYQQLIED